MLSNSFKKQTRPSFRGYPCSKWHELLRVRFLRLKKSFLLTKNQNDNPDSLFYWNFISRNFYIIVNFEIDTGYEFWIVPIPAFCYNGEEDSLFVPSVVKNTI